VTKTPETPAHPGANWGRWGDADERGTANLLDHDHVAGALAGPFSGDVYPLGVTVGRGSPTFGRRAPQHLMSVDPGDFAALDKLDGFAFGDDYLSMACHSSTHIDALSHVVEDGELYNGFSWRDVRSSGARRCAIDKVGAIVTRAHLLDVAGARGVDRLGPEDAIGAEELAKIAGDGGAEIRPGDAVLVRTGFIRNLLADPNRAGAEPGLDPDCADWIQERDIALVGADNSAVEIQVEGQTDEPLHRAVIVGLGAYLIELLDLDAPAAAGVTSGLLVVSPLQIEHGVGSPVNPVLIT
jgi:kynurenine formamidase